MERDHCSDLFTKEQLILLNFFRADSMWTKVLFIPQSSHVSFLWFSPRWRLQSLHLQRTIWIWNLNDVRNISWGIPIWIWHFRDIARLVAKEFPDHPGR
jgi:hypothetical protein